MPDSWLPPWLQPVADSVQSVADPFADWLRSQQPANDAPPRQSRPIPPTNLDDIVIEPPPNPLVDVSEKAVEPSRENPIVDSYRADPPSPPNPLVNSYQIEPPQPSPLVAPYRKPDPGPPHYDFTDAEGADFTAYRPTDPNDIEIIPPFDKPVGYMPPKGSPVPPGTPFDKPGEYVERDPQQTIAPDPMDTAGGFDAKVDEYRGDPELLLRAELDRKAALEAMAAKSAKEQAEKEKADLERSIQIREQARAKALADRAQIEQDARSLADGTPFGNWWASRSTGQKVSNYIAAIFGGLMQGSTGGRNSAIDLMMKAADDDANQKWKSLEMRRQMSGEALNDADAEYKFKETQRAASLQQMKNAVQAQMAGFDPQGKAAQDAGAMLAALDAAQAEQRAKGIADAQKQMLDAFNADTQRITAEAQMKNADSLAWQRGMRGGLGGAGGGGGGAGAGASTAGWGAKDKHTGAEWADHYGIPPDMRKNLNIDERTDGKSFNDWFEKQKALGQMSTDVSRNVSIQQQVDLERKKLIIGYDGKPLINADGQPLMAPTETEGKEVRAKVDNTVQALRLLYEARAIRRAFGDASTTIPNGEANLRLNQIKAQVPLTLKEGLQGVSSDADQLGLARMAGVDKITSVFDQDAALDSAIRHLHDRMNQTLRNRYQYTGSDIIISDPFTNYKPPAKNEVIEVLSKKAPAASTGATVWEAVKHPLSTPLKVVAGDGVRANRLSDEQEAAMAQAEAVLDNPRHSDRAEVTAGLAELAGGGGANPAVRPRAAQAIWRRAKAGDRDARAAYDRLSDKQKAAFQAQLPAGESWEETFGAATSNSPARLAAQAKEK